MMDKINGVDHHDQDHDVMDKISSLNYNHKGSKSSVKWMSSKMRLIQKMSNNNPQKGTTATTLIIDHNSESHNVISTSTTTVRVCSDCNTTSTPLWRSGPRGPKSLCNACGIRQRKARRAMAEAAAAANANLVVTSATTTTASYKIKEKKHWSGNLKNKYNSKLLDTSGVFPQDVTEAALLLMELSYGFVDS
ncbi:GATA transcription factor [Parasponia andersonii]|uniref:GATA transcription factor n=1 Tax=Parasponia andersonii TaxID=3476 RepID=A0A2P5C5N5_PARAD|nr:GATA transcription factor [Parasponia andersonii]